MEKYWAQDMTKFLEKTYYLLEDMSNQVFHTGEWSNLPLPRSDTYYKMSFPFISSNNIWFYIIIYVLISYPTQNCFKSKDHFMAKEGHFNGHNCVLSYIPYSRNSRTNNMVQWSIKAQSRCQLRHSKLGCYPSRCGKYAKLPVNIWYYVSSVKNSEVCDLIGKIWICLH